MREIEIVEPNLLRIKLTSNVQPEPEISAILGDLIHNLRSAIDSLMFAIVFNLADRKSIEISSEDAKQIYFPILNKSKKLREQKMIRKVAGKALMDDIRSVQPYCYSNPELKKELNERIVDGHPLSVLNQMSNYDKHRKLNLVFLDLSNWTLGLDEDSKLIETSTTRIDDRTNIVEMHFKDGSNIETAKFEPIYKVNVDIWKSDWPEPSLFGTVEAIYKKVEYIVGHFSYHLDHLFDPNSGYAQGVVAISQNSQMLNPDPL